MTGYQHISHAGNHGDLLKHLILVQLLSYFKHQQGAVYYIDTHAGAGLYDLHNVTAVEKSEYETGVGHIWQESSFPKELHEYIQIIRNLNPDNSLRYYPGSPWFAYSILGSGDWADFYELDADVFDGLKQKFSSFENITIYQSDGYEALAANLVFNDRRLVVLIDPPYVDQADYSSVLQLVKQAYKKYPDAIYMIWYPIINRERVNHFKNKIVNTGMSDMRSFELLIKDDSEEGMAGSGLMLVNLPQQLEHSIERSLSWLTSCFSSRTS